MKFLQGFEKGHARNGLRFPNGDSCVLHSPQLRGWRPTTADWGFKMIWNRRSVSTNPYQIMKIEISCVDDTRVEVHVHSALYADIKMFEFPDKVSALAFCRAVWLSRRQGDQ